jgi:hypothetical protein
MIQLSTCRWLGLGLGLAVISLGCGPSSPSAAPSPEVTRATSSGPPEPSEIELYEPKARLVDDGVVQFEVKYRFTSGKPSNFYQVDVKFPGSENYGVKFMDGWELQESGVISDGIVAHALPVKEFEISVSEALLPQDGYSLISNTVSGEVEIAADVGSQESADEE